MVPRSLGWALRDMRSDRAGKEVLLGGFHLLGVFASRVKNSKNLLVCEQADDWRRARQHTLTMVVDREGRK
jgi:hypothetical protein